MVIIWLSYPVLICGYLLPFFYLST